MAISSTNLLTAGYHGMVGRQIVLRRWFGRMIMAKCPDFTNVTWSAKQTAHRKKFKKACTRARKMAKDPAIIKEFSKKLKPGQTVYNLVLQKVMKE